MADFNAPALVREFMAFLNCPCTYFAPMSDDEPLTKAYQEALAESKATGAFVPVMVVADKTLLESMILNSDCDCEVRASKSKKSDKPATAEEGVTLVRGGDLDYNPDYVAKFRQDMLALDHSAETGSGVLSDLIAITQEVIGGVEVFEDMLKDESGEEEVLTQIQSWWDFSNDKGLTHPMILAKIPVAKPSEVFAYLPFGGWNECPANEQIMAVSQLWFEKYGAQIVVINTDSLDYIVPHGVDASESRDLAIKQYAFAPDVIDSADNMTINSHAKSLQQSTVWFFWWD